MAIKIERGFNPGAERYTYDFGMCNNGAGWAQVDTASDASYFGTWANPTTRQLFSYCEGDTTMQTAETDEDFAQMVRECADWHKERNEWKGIDPGFTHKSPGADIADRFKAMGLGDLLH